MNEARIKNVEARMMRGDVSLINIPKYVKLIGTAERTIDDVTEHHHECYQYWHNTERKHTQ